MPWSGGTFTRLMNWVNDKNAAIPITASRMDTDSNDFTTGINTALAKDGSNTPTSALTMGGLKILNVGSGTLLTDAVNLNQVQAGVLNWGVAGGTADALTLTVSPAQTTIADGTIVGVRAASANATTAPTFAFNATTARAITRTGGAPLVVGDIPGQYAESFLRYNLANTRWELLNPATAKMRSYIAGLTLSNDSGTPNTVLDIAAGVCADSTNAVMIPLTAFTKSTGGSWAAGTGSNGMGSGLTIANSTWYHVFAIINAGASDVYFDTSVSAANKPASTTFFRRIGSFKTNGSAQITTFSQNGDEFLWSVPVSDANPTGTTTTAGNITLAVPTGVVVNALFRGSFVATAAADTGLLISSPAEANNAAGAPNNSLVSSYIAANGSAVTDAAHFNIQVNTSAQIRVRSTGNGNVSIGTYGWVDTRGRFS